MNNIKYVIARYEAIANYTGSLYMRSIALCIMLLISSVSLSIAQPKPFQATDKQHNALKTQANAFAAAATQHNYKEILYYSYPPAVQQAGGPEKLQAKLTAGMAQLQAMGIVFKSSSVGEIKTIYQSQKDLYCIVQNVIQLSNNGALITSSGYMLAYSHNNGSRWYFTDVALLKKDDPKKLFPTYPPGFVLPETKGPGGIN